MVTLNFGTFPKTTVLGLTPVPKARLDVVNPMAKKLRAKDLVLMMIRFRKIMWIHLNTIKDEQWESSKPKLKGKSCNAISLTTDDDVVTIASLSDSEEEKLALMTQPATSQPVGIWSGKPYMRW